MLAKIENPAGTETHASHPFTMRTWVSIAVACVLTGCLLLLWRGAMPIEGGISALARIDAWDQAVPLAGNLVALRQYYSLSVTTLLFAGLLILSGAVWSRLHEGAQTVIYGLGMTVAISCPPMVYLFSYEG